MFMVCTNNTYFLLSRCVCVYFAVHGCSCKDGILTEHICFVLLLEMESDPPLLLNDVCCIY